MNFAERAFHYLFRKKGKAIILFWVLLITETMILSTVTILRVSEAARIELLGKSKAKLLIEREKAKELFTDDEYKKLEKLENVKAVNRVAEVQLYPMDFKIITKSESVDADNQKLRIMAYDSLEDDGPFADGQIHLTKGNYPHKEGEIVVNQFLAEVNQWEIGETVCFKSHSGEQSQASISGIYISGIEEKQGKEPLAVNRIENTIYGKPEFVCHLQETCGYENLIVYVDNPEQLNRTQLEVTRILKNYRVMKADNLFQKMEIPLLQVVRVVKMMLGLSVVSSVLVITLLLSMWMRARKKEIAIYVSLGKTKVDLFMQIILECFSVFGFSTITALYTGDKMLIVLEKFLDWKSIGAFTSMQIYAQDATRQAIGATFRIEGNEENRRKRLDQAMDVLGDREGSYGGVTHKWLENGADMVVTDNSFETVKEDDVKKIAQVEGIEEYNLITIATVVNPVNFSRIEDPDMDQSTDVGGVNLRGNRIMEMDMDVSVGKISLIEGRMIEKDDRDVCVISKELAELNHLKTGNLLKFNDYHDKEHSTIYSAEIIGIYETKQERKSIMYGDSYRPENTIFTDMSFPEKPSGNEGNPFYQYAIFKVQNAGKYDQVKKSVQKANIDWSRYDLIDNNGNIKNMTENFGQMDQMSMGLLLIVSVSGLVILVLVFLFWIKNRTQEIGIMMSLGKCKFEIWVQFLWEAVMISIIGMLLSFAISPIIAETSASYLAKETQTLRLEQQEQENTGTYIDGYIAPDLKIQDVEVHITKEMVLMDIGMISGILIIAVLVAGITIMKKRPKQILSEMS